MLAILRHHCYKLNSDPHVNTHTLKHMPIWLHMSLSGLRKVKPNKLKRIQWRMKHNMFTTQKNVGKYYPLEVCKTLTKNQQYFPHYVLQLTKYRFVCCSSLLTLFWCFWVPLRFQPDCSLFCAPHHRLPGQVRGYILHTWYLWDKA